MQCICTTNGFEILVDDEDYARMASHTWYSVNRSNLRYAITHIRVGDKFKQVYFHRLLLTPKPGEVIDHVNHNGLDNRRENLRICTHRSNARNSRPHRHATSPYKGVVKYRHSNRYGARIRVEDKHLWLGYFDTQEEAAHAYNAAAIRYFGDYAYLNEVA